MKDLLLILLLFAIPLMGNAQYKTNIKGFHKKYKRAEGATGFTIPGFLVWLGTGLGNEFVKEKEAKIFLKFAKKFKRVRVLAMEDATAVTDDDYQQLLYTAAKKNFEPMISVKSNGQDVNIFAKGKKDKLKNLLIIVKGEGEFVLLDMKTNVKAKDLSRLINDLMKLEKVQKKIKPLPEEQKIELKKKIEKEKARA